MQPSQNVSPSSLPGGIKPEAVSSAAPLPVIIKQVCSNPAPVSLSLSLCVCVVCVWGGGGGGGGVVCQSMSLDFCSIKVDIPRIKRFLYMC